jgi:hypothetical protein
MIKNMMLLGALGWMTVSYAMHPVAQEHMGDAEKFKLDSAVEEQDAQRSVAGERIKKQKKSHPQQLKQTAKDEHDSEVRYWQYSEE